MASLPLAPSSGSHKENVAQAGNVSEGAIRPPLRGPELGARVSYHTSPGLRGTRGSERSRGGARVSARRGTTRRSAPQELSDGDGAIGGVPLRLDPAVLAVR